MYVVRLSPCECMGSQAHSEKLRCVLAFLPLRQPVGEKGIQVVWYNSDVVRLRHQEGKSAVAGIKLCVRVYRYHCTGGGH